MNYVQRTEFDVVRNAPGAEYDVCWPRLGPGEFVVLDAERKVPA